MSLSREELLRLVNLPNTIDEIKPTYEQCVEWMANACDDILNEMLLDLDTKGKEKKP